MDDDDGYFIVYIPVVEEGTRYVDLIASSFYKAN